MEDKKPSSIEKLVALHGGPIAFSRKLGGKPVYQEVQRWVSRGWASPAHIFSLEPVLPKGMTVRDLYKDRELAKRKRKSEVV